MDLFAALKEAKQDIYLKIRDLQDALDAIEKCEEIYRRYSVEPAAPAPEKSKSKKPCSHCKATKTLEEFVKSKICKDGTSNVCKKCKANADRIRHQKDRQLAKTAKEKSVPTPPNPGTTLQPRTPSSPKIDLPFECGTCHGKFLNKEGLGRHACLHERPIQSGTKYKYPCHKCAKAFETADGLAQHIELRHEDGEAG